MDDTAKRPDLFLSTRWSVVRRAVGSGREAEVALDELCRIYRCPVEQFILARTGDGQAAEDLVQEYFADLLRRGYLAKADEDGGKFRAFLCADVKLFLNNARRKALAEKRGGMADFVSLDVDVTADRAGAEEAPADELFDRHWAMEVFNTARRRLRAEYVAQGKEAIFTELERLMDNAGATGMYDAAADRLAMSEGSLKVALHRMRERLGRQLLVIVTDTVRDPAEAREELRYLFRALTFVVRQS